MPMTPPYASLNTSPVWELRAQLWIDLCQTQQPHTKGKSWETHPGRVVSLALSHP